MIWASTDKKHHTYFTNIHESMNKVTNDIYNTQVYCSRSEKKAVLDCYYEGSGNNRLFLLY